MISALTGWHLLILLFCLLPLILALVSIARAAAASGTEKAIWVLIVLLFPLLGAIAWFVIGRRVSRGATGRT